MSPVTDPARELAEITAKLTQGSNAAGENFLAGMFAVEPWSTEFMKVLVCILERADLVGRIVQQSVAMDDDHKGSALNDLTHFKTAFTSTALRVPWNQSGGGLAVMKDHGRPIQYLSPIVRLEVHYPKLSEEEVADFLKLIDAYLKELAKSDEGPEFIRQAIREGLTIFRFQLERIGWMGSGYVLAAFREVMLAYEASKWEFRGEGDLDSIAVLKGLMNIVTKFKEKVDAAEGWAKTGKTVVKGYQLLSSVATPVLLLGKAHGL